MSRYYATVVNGRGNETAVGGRSSIESAHIRAWDVGVRVKTYTGAGRDQIMVYLTSGSHASGPDKLLGTVMLDHGSPVFVSNFPVHEDSPGHITEAFRTGEE